MVLVRKVIERLTRRFDDREDKIEDRMMQTGEFFTKLENFSQKARDVKDVANGMVIADVPKLD